MSSTKKTQRVDIEQRRTEMFLVAVVLVLSSLYCALEWQVPLADDDSMVSFEDIIEDIDFAKLREDFDMVPAVAEVSVPEHVSSVVVAAETEPEELLTPMEEAADGIEDGSDDAMECPETAAQLLITPLNDHETLVVMEQMPQFPGGASAFMKWLTANIKYPSTARDRKIQGKIVVSFIVDSDGTTTALKIEETSNSLLSNVVLAALRRMPPWQPGVQNGKTCATMIKVPINFEL